MVTERPVPTGAEREGVDRDTDHAQAFETRLAGGHQRDAPFALLVAVGLHDLLADGGANAVVEGGDLQRER